MPTMMEVRGAVMPSKKMSPLCDEPAVPFTNLLPTIAGAILAIVIFNAAWEVWRDPGAHASVVAPSHARQLRLRATMNAQQLEISWDHDAAAIRAAEKATLRVSDGDITEAIPFEASQLQDGVLVYKPRTNDISLRMEVNERDGTQVSESVRAVATP
jgi:hypothetical protein